MINYFEIIDKILKDDCWCRYDWMDHYESDNLDRDGNGYTYLIYINDGYITHYMYNTYEDSRSGELEIIDVDFENFEKWYKTKN